MGSAVGLVEGRLESSQTPHMTGQALPAAVTTSATSLTHNLGSRTVPQMSSSRTPLHSLGM